MSSSTSDRAFKQLLLIALGTTALVMGAITAVRSQVDAPPAVQTYALTDCRLPSEAETLLVTVNVHGDRLVASCTFVGARGSYVKERRR